MRCEHVQFNRFNQLILYRKLNLPGGMILIQLSAPIQVCYRLHFKSLNFAILSPLSQMTTKLVSVYCKAPANAMLFICFSLTVTADCIIDILCCYIKMFVVIMILPFLT